MKILIAVDGSEFTKKAINHTMSHLDWFREHPELHLLHVMLPIPPGRARAALGSEDIHNYYKVESENALATAENMLRERKIPFKSSWVVGMIAEQIREYAEKHQIDMIVMGSHGHGAFQNLVLGSVATKVLAATTTPVLIVR